VVRYLVEKRSKHSRIKVHNY